MVLLLGFEFVGLREPPELFQLAYDLAPGMPYAKWARVYLRTQPTEGVVLLLVEKLDLAPGTTVWTCADALRRAQTINVRRRPELTTRAARGVHYTPVPAFTPEEKLEIEHLSRDLVLRAMRGQSIAGAARIVRPVPPANPGQPARARPSRARLLWGVCRGFSGLMTWFWARRIAGTGVAGAYLGWRVFSWTGAMSYARWCWSTTVMLVEGTRRPTTGSSSSGRRWCE